MLLEYIAIAVMIVVATDAPLSDRNLGRLARRALGGLARTGASLSDGSGDYALAFSTAESVRRTPRRRCDVGKARDWLYRNPIYRPPLKRK